MNLEKLITKYEKIIEITIRKIGNMDYETKEDMKQDLRMFLFLKLKTMVEANEIDNISNLDGYVFMILKNQSINLIKDSRYKKSISLNTVTDNGSELIDLIKSNEENELINIGKVVEDMKMILDKREFKIFCCYYIEGKSYSDIARTLKYSEATIRRRIKKMSEILKKWG